MLQDVLTAFGINDESIINSHGSGLINRTYHVTGKKGDFILQKLNESVFSNPGQIAENIDRVSRYMKSNFPDAIFPTPLKTTDGETLLHIKQEGYFRIFPFIRNSVSFEVVKTPTQAYNASKKFGEFTRMLAGFPIESLNETLPDFHNLSYRYKAFRNSVRNGNPERKHKSEKLITYLESQNLIVSTYEDILKNSEFRRRVTHHDTKISNVLFNETGKGLCVIDLDTIMPGYFISDVGDMFRTYLSPVSEEEKDFNKIEIRLPVFDAIIEGYLEEMNNELTRAEKDAVLFAGEFMMYMQSLRFLTDYLNNDIYYGSRYQDHNFIRAGNQANLLQKFQEVSSYMREKLAAVTSIEDSLIKSANANQ
jgi:Ser/Thr protein kinase RdoA (MazF antagonist)